MSAHVQIHGERVHGIDDFYAQINEQVMQGEDWSIGSSLDALNDLLYGGIGALAGQEHVRWVVTGSQAMREALGYEATHAWLSAKLDPELPFDRPAIREQLDRLEATGHPTYFELILEVFADHPGVELVLE